MYKPNANSRHHLVSGVCFLVAGGIELFLGLKIPNRHVTVELALGGAFLVAGAFQLLAYLKRRPA